MAVLCRVKVGQKEGSRAIRVVGNISLYEDPQPRGEAIVTGGWLINLDGCIERNKSQVSAVQITTMALSNCLPPSWWSVVQLANLLYTFLLHTLKEGRKEGRKVESVEAWSYEEVIHPSQNRLLLVQFHFNFDGSACDHHDERNSLSFFFWMNSLEIDINALCVMWISEVLYSRFPVVSKQKKCHCHSAALGGGLEGGILICTPDATRRWRVTFQIFISVIPKKRRKTKNKEYLINDTIFGTWINKIKRMLASVRADSTLLPTVRVVFTNRILSPL